MERLLHYVWQHRLYTYGSLHTQDGTSVEVIDPGVHNTDAGPDFLNAKIKIGDEMWAGNVEIHLKSHDWYRHSHEKDIAYNSVILHVVETDEGQVKDNSGRTIHQVTIAIPQYVKDNYQDLLQQEKNPYCYTHLQKISNETWTSWLQHLLIERLDSKCERIERWVELLGGDWESAFFVNLARTFGFGINGDIFEQWALSMPLKLMGRHRDNPFQIEALFMGQAGLLDESLIHAAYLKTMKEEGYFDQLKKEYQFLAHKFSLRPIDGHLWHFMRMRPQNFPHIRLSQLARLYCDQKVNLSLLTETKNLEEARKLFYTEATPYWRTHYSFGALTSEAPKALTHTSLDIIIINAMLPMLYAYGQHKAIPAYQQKAIQWLYQIPAEKNSIIQLWNNLGINITSAAHSQAFLQLNNQFCKRKDCLRCMIGISYIQETNVYHVLREETHNHENIHI